jgi:hypothetical protein
LAGLSLTGFLRCKCPSVRQHKALSVLIAALYTSGDFWFVLVWGHHTPLTIPLNLYSGISKSV